MSHEQVGIQHGGYTDTLYATCGTLGCTMAVLDAVGLTRAMMKDHGADGPEDVNGLPVGDDTLVTVSLLDESDSDEWCAACGDFLRHGLSCECEKPEKDREAQDGPHPDLASAQMIKRMWA